MNPPVDDGRPDPLGPPDLPDLPDLPDEVLELRERYGAESPLVHLDPDEPLELLLHARLRTDPGYAARLAAGWARLTAGTANRDEAFQEAFRPLGPLPAGPGWPSWARYVARLIPRIAAGEADFPPRHGPPAGQPLAFPPSRFTDAATANRASTTVLRRHEDEFRRWGADPEGRPRMFLAADLGEPIGTRPVSEVPGESLAGHRPAELLRACVVLLRRDGGGRPYIATSYPEAALPEGPRLRHPDLPMLLGGFFGMDLHALDRTAWDAERRFVEQASPAVRARVTAQLLALLDEHPDGVSGTGDRLRADVAALGAHLVPIDCHRWLRGLARRFTEIA